MMLCSKIIFRSGLGAVAMTLFIASGAAQDSAAALSNLDKFALSKERDSLDFIKSVAEQLERSPKGTASLIIAKLKTPNATEKQLAAYIWALGVIKDPAAVAPVMAMYRESKSELVQGNCLRTLALTGGKPAGDFLLSVLNATRDKDMRFGIINLLAQMQYEAALPATAEILQQDPKKYYWQIIIIFCKMGDKAVPFLVSKINDSNVDVRINAANVLGKWLIAPEAAQPLQDQYRREQDLRVRGLILIALERIIPDVAKMKLTFEQIAADEKDENLLNYARVTLSNIGLIESRLAEYAKKKQNSAFLFERDYDELFKSEGRSGNYELLAIFSTAKDEPKLKKLREKILTHDSEGTFNNFQKVNDIIMRNRMIKPPDKKP
ncbi:MAG: HEAT repeat domain-containing protein [Victivallaceae bacterium]